MKVKIIRYTFLLFVIQACSIADFQGTFHSSVLKSSTGEKIYVNAINWGVTGDYQLTVISSDSLRLKDRNDTIGAVEGLNPFIYQFNKDTLTLFFYKTINYKMEDQLKSITVISKVVDESEYLKLTINPMKKVPFIPYRKVFKSIVHQISPLKSSLW